MKWRKRFGIYPWHHQEEIPLLLSGAPFFEELLKQIYQARESIHLQIYIYDGDETGFMVYQALLEAAKRGVKINLVLDAFGSKSFPREWQLKLENQGAEVAFFSRFKLAFKFHTGTRLHHKIIIFDKQKALLGGINISNHYSAFGSGKTWLDFGVVLQGNIVLDLLVICYSFERKTFLRKHPVSLPYLAEKGPIKARILQNHWAKARFGISKQYRHKIRESKEQITLIASYFLPSMALKRMLKNAQKRGVQVTLVLSGISDVPLVRKATHHLYSDLLKSGVKIYEWQDSVLHAKVAFIDKDWTCIGSYNINHLSDFGSTECNIEIVDVAYQEQNLKLVKLLMNKSAKAILADDYRQKLNFIERLSNYLAYHIMRISLRVLFYFQSDLQSPFKRR
jgi:cardiolipin synthase